MITFLSTLLRHYIFCFIGASLRFLWDLIIIKTKKKHQSIKFKDYHNYDENSDTEIIDAIVGFIVFGIIIFISIKVINKHSW